MLVRYRRLGGFKQLLTLIETSPESKRETLMKVVANEDRRWAVELSKRILTMQKVITWDYEQIEKIIQQIPNQTWPKAFFHVPEPQRGEIFKNLLKFLTHHKQTETLELIALLNPSKAEIEAAHVLIIKKARELQAAGELRPQSWDPDLSMDGLEKVLF